MQLSGPKYDPAPRSDRGRNDLLHEPKGMGVARFVAGMVEDSAAGYAEASDGAIEPLPILRIPS